MTQTPTLERGIRFRDLTFSYVATTIRLQREPAGCDIRRVPSGKPVAIALAGLGMLSTVLAIILPATPADDEPNLPLALRMTVLVVAGGFAVFQIGSWKGRATRESEILQAQ